MSEIRTQTIQPQATGSVHGAWREQCGGQGVDIRVDPAVARSDCEFRLSFSRRWGPQLGDVKSQDFRLSREGAEVLRDALTAALEWTP